MLSTSHGLSESLTSLAGIKPATVEPTLRRLSPLLISRYMSEQVTTTYIEYGLSLGSNVGNRLKHLTDARDLLDGIPSIEILDSAPVYETEPVGVKPEHMNAPYLNTVLIVITSFSPEELLDITQEIETRCGRIREEERNAPRPLDIDIIYAGQQAIDRDGIIIPHPRWASRRFVLQPLATVRPGLLLPGERKTVQEMLDKLGTEPKVILYREKW